MARILNGTVVSTKMEKTAVVEVERAYRHRLYHKTIKRHKKYKAHLDGTVLVAEGDVVDIQECLPISKDKKFKVVKKYHK
ncbi:30S ribosomal protein S17 [Candidatus Roizmanbacteria bacterium RIFCSPHIGHO2_02_FULL_40_9]|uniref:Small ribosomal subunit protein uS17 n=2 Tax=Candidatus Roizmaniibacteriota TaxID=1752723 RepID=A0A1F7IKX8_9BACT|nr:MAG: 30S ribosomal protein S17 [Candidatus Roizmanbacteria bacterium RIFCSPHIGHO2_02_FULL_40_9]OGK44015.1 MAG: 30S ribosomal protein S17 [Candidatus Roizmanbacteria bacterium RIFCSPLOWO2_01_FULL_38_11]